MVENFQKNLIALTIVFGIVGAEFVRVNGVGIVEAILVGSISALFAAMISGVFTEILYDGTLEEENFS